MSGPQPGVLLAERYRLVEMIGRGGMGQVWRATDEVLHREVAVKTVGGWSERTAASEERFRREALAVARLNHRRVAGVYDYLETGGVSFIVMQLLDGESLAERLARERMLPAADAAEIVAQAAEGLQAAHDAGITHRDVKPANIMLTAHGVKLLDFGLAATTWETGLTSTGMMVGTLGYLSPERAAGKPATEAGDVYSLGVVLYEALAGHQPFRADNPLALVHAQSVDPPALPASTPPQLAAACVRALATDPADRLPTAAAFAAAVRGHAGSAPSAGSVHTAREHTTEQLAVPPRRRRPGRRAVLLGIVAVALLVAVLVFWPGSGESPGTGEQAPTTQTPGDRAGEPRRAAGAAFRALLDDIAEGAESGDIRREAARDVAKTVKGVRKQLAKGESTDLATRLEEIDRTIDDHARDGAIKPEAAGTLHEDVRAIAAAADR